MATARRSPPLKIPKQATVPQAIPRRVVAPSLRDHLDIVTRAVFQAGLSWAIIAARWPAFVAAFEEFDVGRVAGYGEADIARLLATDGLIHSAKKMKGTIANARELLDLNRQYGSIEAYFQQFRSYRDLFADAHERFAFLGDVSCYYWLFRTGSRVPVFEDWIGGQRTDHPRVREMVMTGRAEQTTSEDPAFGTS